MDLELMTGLDDALDGLRSLRPKAVILTCDSPIFIDDEDR